MSASTLQPLLPGNSKRSKVVNKPATDFYSGLGWLIGLLFTLFISAPAIWFLTNSATRSAQDETLLIGLAVAWWLNPLSLGGLFYVLSNIRVWRFWTLLGLFVWGIVNVMVSVSIASADARAWVLSALSVVGLILLGLFFIYIQLRVFVWAASGNAGRFFFGILGWSLLNGLVVWALINPDVLNIVLVAMGYILQVVFAIGFAVIQFVAIFWFMSQTRVEVIRPGDPKQITFEDYKGQPNLLKMVRQWIYLLSDREQFQKMGGQFITGLLLYGEPGTGKTLLAKAMAGEAGIAFISIEGSGFRGMFWGVDVLRMIQFVNRARKLAREYGACIAYIDEIDAVGMSRGGVMGGGGQMMGGMGGMMGGGSGALTRLLYEMDGIGTLTSWEKLRARFYQLLRRKEPVRDWHVMFMGSTNRPDVLDPALVRPGRFDRKIAVGLPDRGGRREIVKYYLSKIKHDDTVDIEALVSDTSWATPARIMSAVTKDAVRLALFDGRDKISQRDIELAFQEQAIGLENPIEEMEEDQRRQVAYHEAGHAVVQHYLRPDERIVRVSIVRRADALGYVLPVSNFDVYAMPLRRFVADIMVSMAGHVATKVFLGEYWTGATSDFQNVRARLWQLAHFGYFGPPISMDGNMGVTGNFSGRDKMVEKFWQQLEDQTEQVLRAHTAEVEAVTKALLERGDLTGRECVEIIRKAAGEDLETSKPDSEKLLNAIVEDVIGEKKE
ncbi:MAG TPA: AAA family ATPase [Anaerolineales bacterium]|nr:AAA family ATPase [Anaerolineales bacterium]HNN14051.1 AAA family ATPase [Anaerolineales bacterium]HNO30148.1 AAA family ATPase [Anaerolineales bacterium]